MRDVALVAGQDHQAGGLGLPVALFALAGGGVVQWLPLLPSLLMSAAALAGGLSAILPAASTALNTYLDRRQARRHAEAEFRRKRVPRQRPFPAHGDGPEKPFVP